MLDGLKRIFQRASATGGQWSVLSKWASAQQAQFKVAPDESGFAIDGRGGSVPWRLEWGEPQRAYVPTRELRLRADVSVPGAVQALVLNEALRASMEQAVFDQYVEGVQTRIDDQTPPEMRWLVMFPKLSAQDLGPLAERFAAVAPSRSWLMSWLSAGLGQALKDLPVGPEQPFVLMVSRGRLTLRASMPDATPEGLSQWLALFTAAVRAAPRELAPDSALPSTQPGSFTASAPSVEDEPPRN